MVKERVIVKNETGLHARPASLLVKLTASFSSDIFFIKEGSQINGKSIMGIMAMAAQKGDEIEIVAEGSDEKEALAAIVNLFQQSFNE